MFDQPYGLSIDIIACRDYAAAYAACRADERNNTDHAPREAWDVVTEIRAWMGKHPDV